MANKKLKRTRNIMLTTALITSLTMGNITPVLAHDAVETPTEDVTVDVEKIAMSSDPWDTDEPNPDVPDMTQKEYDNAIENLVNKYNDGIKKNLIISMQSISKK